MNRPTAARCWPGETGFILLLWIALALVLALFQHALLGQLSFRDPDDALRLVEVRNWINGQGWFDVGQPRIDPPHGGTMHWSRLVDVPIAALILLLKPLVGAARAELLAIAILPPVLGLLYLLLIRSIMRAFAPGDRAVQWTGMVVSCTMFFVVYQFAPNRIDHHGWQLLLSLALLRLALAQGTLRIGLLMGGALALHLIISLEGLPFVALFGGLAGIAYLIDGREFARLKGLVAGLAAGCLALVLLTRGPAELGAQWCDALSRQHVAAFVAVALLLLAAERVLGSASLVRRLIPCGIAGAAGALLFVGLAPQCLAGPFSTLDPLVERLWYRNVVEGLPVWTQVAQQIVTILVPSLVAFAGLAYAWRRNPDRRSLYLKYGFVLLGSFLLSLAISRGMYGAHAVASVSIAGLIVGIWRWARAIEATVPRILGSLLVALPIPPVATVIAYQLVPEPRVDKNVLTAQAGSTCTDPEQLATLIAMPPTTVFAPLDIGPAILVTSRHSVIATGHHRNSAAMKRVIAAFTETPERAEALVRGTPATILAYCRGYPEMAIYRTYAPHSLAEALETGHPPAWLQLLTTGQGLRIYRIRPPRRPVTPP